MSVIILVIHLMIAIALVGSVLLQRSEGGALGIGGGGGGGGGFMSGRGVANALTRTTTILAFAFFVTSITLTLLARQAEAPSSIFDGVAPTQQSGAPASGSAPAEAVLPDIGTPKIPSGPEVPVSQ
jgi:preprotein translocase subunit SecG